MSDTDDTVRAIQALRERYGELVAELAEMDHRRAALVARMDENRQSLDLVQRNGRKKPGPKVGGTRLATTELASVATDAEHEP